MIIKFEDGSFIETRKSFNSDKFVICIAAKNPNDRKKVITNSVELTKEQIMSLLNDYVK
jgi:hypothetical protein